jgi:hypothetical protein
MVSTAMFREAFYKATHLFYRLPVTFKYQLFSEGLGLLCDASPSFFCFGPLHVFNFFVFLGEMESEMKILGVWPIYVSLFLLCLPIGIPLYCTYESLCGLETLNL